MAILDAKFIKFPVRLFYDYCYLSIEARYLFAFLLDRYYLSKTKKMMDKDKNIFLICSQSEVTKILNIGDNKAISLFKELEKSNLITRKRQGYGQPARIYINDTMAKCSFVKIPKQFSEKETKLTIGEMLLLYLLKNRLEKSISNNWVDNNNEVYVSFKQIKIAEIFNIGKKKVIQMFKSLVSNKFIRTVRYGNGKPSRIYFINDNSTNSNEKKDEEKHSSNKEMFNFDTTYTTKNEPSKIFDFDTTYTNTKTEINNTELTISISEVKKQINYKYLESRNNNRLLNFIVLLLANFYINHNKKDTYIQGIKIPFVEVKKALNQLRSEHIEKIINTVNHKKIINLRQYIITCLYTQGVSIPCCQLSAGTGTSYDITAFDRYDIFD